LPYNLSHNPPFFPTITSIEYIIHDGDMLMLDMDEKGERIGHRLMHDTLPEEVPNQVWTKLPLKGSMTASPPRKAVQIGE
jgi:hypothetical protein